MNWFSILKANIRNEAQYEAASLEERMRWHTQQNSAYRNRLSVLRTQHTVDLTDTENPVYQEMQEYQRLRNFHSRQYLRLKVCIRSGRTECNDYYSEELEGDNRARKKLQTTPTGKLDPYVELSLEAYNNLTDNQKRQYHKGMSNNGKDIHFHNRMFERIGSAQSVRPYNSLNLPTFPSPKYGGDATTNEDRALPMISREEYENMDKEGKKKFHARERRKMKRKGKAELTKFHSRMWTRLYRNINLPTYYSPEHEQEES